MGPVTWTLPKAKNNNIKKTLDIVSAHLPTRESNIDSMIYQVNDTGTPSIVIGTVPCSH